MSLVEAVASMSVAAIGLLGFSGVIVNSSVTQQTVQTRWEAVSACRTMIEDMRGVDIATVLESYSGDTATGIVGATQVAHTGTTGTTGTVKDGYTYDVKFPLGMLPRKTSAAEVEESNYGLQDTNRDGLVDGISGDARTVLLPVRIEAKWTIGGVEHSVIVESLITGRR